MKLATIISAYITLKQSLGMRYKTNGSVLRAFCRFMGDIDISDVHAERVQSFLVGKGPVTLMWFRKHYMLAGFYDFAIHRGYATSSPLPTMKPKRPEPFQPYIYSTEELRRLLTATDVLRIEGPRVHRLRADTFRTLLLILYGAGLRLGEALSLTLADVDLSKNLITVWDSKFFKSRLVPIGPRLTAELCSYARKCEQRPRPGGRDSAFLATRTGTHMCGRYADQIFQVLRKTAGIHRDDGARYQPRLHDLRHTFAVHRLIDWYRKGADVQRLLPQLSTYLGHVEVAATQCYLSMTAELLQEANRRFERYALSEVCHV